MKPVAKTDGSSITVIYMPHSIFVDPPRGSNGGRGGPDHPRHFCRFEDYGLMDDMWRCRKCGLVREGGDLDYAWDGKNYQSEPQ